MSSLARQAVLGFAKLAGGLGILLFALPGTLGFWQAWLYLALFLGSSAAITVYLWKHDRKLLERRVHAGPGAEKAGRQKVIQLFAAIAFIGALVVPSLDHRFEWSEVPLATVFAGDVLVALGFYIFFAVFRVNTFAAATIEVAIDQRVVSSGPYAIVRHPLYAGALVMLLGTPLALGSWWGLLGLIPITLTIVWRLLEEEKFLSEHLPGYAEYKKRVRYRLLPFVW